MMTSTSAMLSFVLIAAVSVFPDSVSAGGDFIHFSYTGYQEPLYFNEYESLMGQEVLKRCVRREYPPEGEGHCRNLEKTCLWGSQRCDGELEPTTRCNCRNDNWTCQSFFCPTMEPLCPATNPSGEDPAPICKKDMKCAYEKKICDDCPTLEVPTVVCSCEAGQPLTCETIEPCATYGDNCVKMELAMKDGDIFPVPKILEFKMNKEKPPPAPNSSAQGTTVKPGDGDGIVTTASQNAEGCPAEEPFPNNRTDISCPGTGYECDYGYSCCCPDGSECSSDLKCDCVDGNLVCKPKACDAFLCVPPPQLLHSPFPDIDFSVNNALCPSQPIAAALHADELANSTDCSVTDQEDFYHCVYGYSCCCPSDADDEYNYDGRFCSSELQCSCSAGVFTCDARECKTSTCEGIVAADGAADTKVVCPAVLPDQHAGCTIGEGDTCGFDEVECADGSKHAKHYCSCEGGGVWDCFDASYLCDQ